MEIVVIGGLLVAVVLAFNFGSKATASAAKVTIAKLLSDQAHDRMNFLSTLRRELANILIWSDPVRFRQLYQLVMTETGALKDLTSKGAQQRLDALSAKYPNYQDFDIIGTRVYVLYPDAISMHDMESIEQAYRDIATFQGIMIASDPNWKNFTVASAKESDHLAKYVRRIQDTKLRLDIESAIQQYYLSNKANDRADYETNEFIVRRVQHFAENRLGVIVKATGEHGLYGFFVSDNELPDGSPKIYYGYYRSDATFQEETRLDSLNEVVDWRRSPSGRVSQSM